MKKSYVCLLLALLSGAAALVAPAIIGWFRFKPFELGHYGDADGGSGYSGLLL